jgi:hypothetical protein
LGKDGKGFKCVKTYEPYFYLHVKDCDYIDLEEYLRNKYRSLISRIESVEKEDLELVK